MTESTSFFFETSFSVINCQANKEISTLQNLLLKFTFPLCERRVIDIVLYGSLYHLNCWGWFLKYAYFSGFRYYKHMFTHLNVSKLIIS
jgi:hypothetical protein